jgi:alkylation response protein AidB-like acyl-CoA dehydrogenase
VDFCLTPEHEELRQRCRELAADFATRAAQHDREGSLPVENYAALKQAGLYSLTIPREFGGQGAGLLGWTLAAEELAQGCPATALTFNMHITALNTIIEDPVFARPTKERVARLVVHEQKLLAASISETGTSGLLLAPTFVPTGQVRRVAGGYLLRGRKVFLSMMEGSDYIFLFLHPEEATNPFTVRIFLVPRPLPGQRVEEVWDTLGMRGTRSNDLVLDDCFVPEDTVLGNIENSLAWFQTRPTWGAATYTSVYLGVGVAAYRQACAMLTQRIPRGFAQPLSYHPDIRRRVAEMSVDLEAARLLTYQAAWLADTVGMTPATRAAMLRAKYFVGEAVARVTRSALTACGAHALFKTSPLERLFRDGASAPIMPPAGDACLNGIGVLELGLEPQEIVPALKVAKREGER